MLGLTQPRGQSWDEFERTMRLDPSLGYNVLSEQQKRLIYYSWQGYLCKVNEQISVVGLPPQDLLQGFVQSIGANPSQLLLRQAPQFPLSSHNFSSLRNFL